MHIRNLKIRNYKCLRDVEVDFRIPNGDYGSGLNIFVGENNSGKSSLMESVYFVRNKTRKDVKRIGTKDGEDAYVEQTFVGEDISSVVDAFVQDNKKKSFKDNIYKEESGKQFFRVRRLFTTDDEAKKIYFYNNDKKDFSNPAGIDAPFQKFFQISNIWADTNPENESKYGSTTVCGNLLSDISEKFKIDHEEQYKKFLQIFNETFNDEKAGLQADLNEVAKETEEILNDQFGNVSLRFKFDNPEPDILFKNIKIFVNDGEETEISEKGHGLQRAVILSLLQVYAKRVTELKDENGDIKLKPHFLFIDEPELGLHPQAQRKLFEALCSLAKTHQVFISTHSENFISTKVIENIYKLNKSEGGDVSIYSVGEDEELNLSENRSFFLHHHRLFFAKNAIFLEGVDDLERFPLFCDNEKYSNVVKDFQLLTGCSQFPTFEKFCTNFGVQPFFIFDIDLLSKTNTANRGFGENIRKKIEDLDKEVNKKDPSNLFDENLSNDEKKKKRDLLDELRERGFYILKNGSVEHYLSERGEVISGNTEKEEELKSIFKTISNKYKK